MNTAPLLHAPNPGSSHHISPPLSLSPRFPAPCPDRAGALGAQVCPQIPRGEGPRGTAPSGLSPPPPPPHLVAVGAVALAEDHDAVGGDEGPHAELQPVPVREPGLSRRRRHGGTGAFPAAAALTPGRARPFRSGQRDETGRPIRRERGEQLANERSPPCTSPTSTMSHCKIIKKSFIPQETVSRFA